MRSLSLVVVVLGGCASALEQRVSDLEAKPTPVPVKDPTLDHRIAELEKYQRKQAAELKELQEVVHKVADQLAESLAAQPMPPAPPPLPTGHRNPDPNKVYAVPIDDSPRFGPPGAAVTLVAAVQFPEPFTHKSWPVLQQLQSEYGKELRLVVKSYVVHPQAAESSIAACAAGNQNKLDAFEAKVWDAHQATRWPDAAVSRDVAKRVGVDLKRFDRDVTGPCRAGQTRDVKMFSSLGQSAVPMFWINGRPLSGAQPVEAFRLVIDDEKAKALADRNRGGNAATYYNRTIANGATSP